MARAPSKPFARRPDRIASFLTRVLLAATGALPLVLLASPDALACSTCGCGDPTLTAMGTEKPYAGRLRLSFDTRYRTDAIGQERVDRISLSEVRSDGQVAWAPTPKLFLLATVPFLVRRVDYVNGAAKDAVSIGDLELRGKSFLYLDREFGTRHSIAITYGLKLPTAPRQTDERGKLLPNEVQPGTGSFDPMLGLAYAGFFRPWSIYASVWGSAPLRSRSENRASSSVRGTFTVQYQWATRFATRLGTDLRLDGPSYEDGARSRDSGGFVAFLSPEIVLSPKVDWVVVLSARIPVLQALAGFHHEGPVLGVAVGYDW
jgi:hypothetical protein